MAAKGNRLPSEEFARKVLEHLRLCGTFTARCRRRCTGLEADPQHQGDARRHHRPVIIGIDRWASLLVVHVVLCAAVKRKPLPLSVFTCLPMIAPPLCGAGAV